MPKNSRKASISWSDFEKIDFRGGTVVKVEDFPEARKPAYKVHVDFGPGIGILRTSARFTELYTQADLLGKQVLGVVNFPPKQIGPVQSQFLLCGFYREDGAVVLAVADRTVPRGAPLA